MNVDIVIPVRNGEIFIADCLESIFQQSRFDLINRVIVVNDGSTDNTAGVVARFADKLPNLELINIAPSGLSAARNLGLSVATATYVAFLDSDDMWLKRKIEYHVNHLINHPDCNFSFTLSLEFQDNPDVLLPQGTNQVPVSFDSILLQEYRIYGSGSSVFASRQFLSSSGGFNTSLSFGEDWDLWLKMALLQLPCEIPDYGTLIRIHSSSMQRMTKLSRNRFSNSDIHFREWENYPSIFSHPAFHSKVTRILWAEIRRNLDFNFLLSNDLRNFHHINHEKILNEIGLANKRFFKTRIFMMKILDFLTERFK